MPQDGQATTPRDTPKVNDKRVQKAISAPGGLNRILSSINFANSSAGDSSKQSTPGVQGTQPSTPLTKATPAQKPTELEVAPQAVKLPGSISKMSTISIPKPKRKKHSEAEYVEVAIPTDGSLHVTCKDIKGALALTHAEHWLAQHKGRTLSSQVTKIYSSEGDELTPVQFEAKAGLKSSGRWKRTIAVKATDGSEVPLGDFLDAYFKLPAPST